MIARHRVAVHQPVKNAFQFANHDALHIHVLASAPVTRIASWLGGSVTRLVMIFIQTVAVEGLKTYIVR